MNIAAARPLQAVLLATLWATACTPEDLAAFTIEPEPVGENCPDGGVRIDDGLTAEDDWETPPE